MSRRRPGARKRAARRRMLVRTALGVGIAAAAVAIVVLVPWQGDRDPMCAEHPASFPESGVAGWSGDQLENAATIVLAARERGLGRDAQILGVMAAMGESTLHNIDYGDWETSGVRNPDGTRTSSIGLFQQQSWWGSVEERMDPATAAGRFFDRLERLDGWQDLDPSHAIHRVQINTDPEHYAPYEPDAAAVVDALSGPCPVG